MEVRVGDRRAVVIGGGITGALTARQLQQDGWAVTVLEGAWIGAGSSSRTAAGIRQQFSTPENVRAMRWCVDFYKAWAEHTGVEQLPIVQNGYLFLYNDPQSWSVAVERTAMQRAAGLAEVEALEAQALRARFPWVGGTDLCGGTWCPTDGFLHPDRIYSDAMARAKELGTQVVQKAPVTGALSQSGRIVGVQTPKGVFEADIFLDCTNAWTRRTAELLGAQDLPVDPLKRYLWFLKRGGPMTAQTLGSMPLTILPSGLYFRPENADTLMMGKKHDAAPERAFTYDDQDVIVDPYGHDSGIDAVPFELWAEACDSVPDLAEFEGLNATTGGYYGTTPDHNPFLGYDGKLSNLIRLVGFSGHGAMFGPFTALVAAALADAGQDVPAVSLFGEPVSLGGFALDRVFAHSETMVI